jgi:hypothetical protein
VRPSKNPQEAGRLDNLLVFRKRPSSGEVRGHAVGVGIVDTVFFFAALDQFGGPGLVGQTILETRRNIV